MVVKKRKREKVSNANGARQTRKLARSRLDCFAARADIWANNYAALAQLLREFRDTNQFKVDVKVISSAVRGFAAAQVQLACWYKIGLGVKRNEEKAFEWVRRASLSQSKEAQYVLGNFYADGVGVEQNYRKAIELYLLSAEQGYVRAQYHIGVCYKYGDGIKKNQQRAFFWIKKAACGGHCDAQLYIGVCYQMGVGVAVNKQEAAEFYFLAAKQSCSAAQNNYAMCLYHGEGVNMDKKECLKWLVLAEKKGNTQALINLVFYNEAEKETLIAQELNKKALAMNIDLDYARAFSYEKGYIFQKNIDLSRKYYQISARKGNANAKEKLAEMVQVGSQKCDFNEKIVMKREVESASLSSEMRLTL
jgi:uncharacterized protein